MKYYAQAIFATFSAIFGMFFLGRIAHKLIVHFYGENSYQTIEPQIMNDFMMGLLTVAVFAVLWIFIYIVADTLKTRDRGYGTY